MSKGKEFRRPRSKSSKRFKIKKEPAEHINYDLCKPVFSFHYMQYRMKNCLTCCTQFDKASVSEKLVMLSQLTWGQLASEPKTGLGYEKIDQSQFKIPLPKAITPDINIQVFRHSEAGRIAGFREKDVYHVVVVGDELYDH
jgi:hypothetical protein